MNGQEQMSEHRGVGATATRVREDNGETLIEIVLRAKEGDQGAFAKLVEQFRMSMECWVRRVVRNDTDIADVCQEVWLLVWQKLNTLQDPACFPGWLRRVAFNLACRTVACDGRRRKLVRCEVDVAGGNCVEDGSFLDQVPAGENSSLDEELVKENSARKIQTCMEQLKPIDRESLADQFMDELTLKQASQKRGVPEGTTKRRWHVARGRFREKWEKMPAA